jgi:hypothetical protein
MNEPVQILEKGRDILHPSAQRFVRIPGGHPEGTYEAFANLYLAYAEAHFNRHENSVDSDFPSISDGIYGMEFIERCLDSSKKHGEWVSMT